MLLTPAERRALLTLLALLIFGQLASIWQERRRARPDRELSSWLMRIETIRADTLSASSDSAPSDRDAGPSSADDSGLAADSTTLHPPGRAPTAVVESLAASPPGLLEGGRVRVNVASAQDLELLPGIGPALARRIFEDRSHHGSFRRPEDLLRVKGVGEKTLRRLAAYLDFTSP